MIFRYSEFSAMADFGLLCAVGLITAVLADLVVTPIFLRHVRLVSIFDILGLDLNMDPVRQSPLFVGISNYQIRKTVFLCDMEEFKDQDEIIIQGTKDDHMYVILSGEVSINVFSGNMQSKANEKTFITKLSEGEVFGEIGFTSKIKRTAQAQAEGNVKLLRLSAKDIKRSLKLYPNIAVKLYQNITVILGKRLHEKNVTIS